MRCRSARDTKFESDLAVVMVTDVGTAGLDTARLEGLLLRLRIDCDVVEGDRDLDHCVLRLSTARRTPVVAFVEYVNQGVGARLVGMMVKPAGFDLSGEHSSIDWQETLKLEGACKADPEKIARWIETKFLRG